MCCSAASLQLSVHLSIKVTCSLVPRPSSFKEERGSDEYSTSSHYGLAVAMDFMLKAKPLKSLAEVSLR